jgi:hypothetical protein
LPLIYIEYGYKAPAAIPTDQLILNLLKELAARVEKLGCRDINVNNLASSSRNFGTAMLAIQS